MDRLEVCQKYFTGKNKIGGFFGDAPIPHQEWTQSNNICYSSLISCFTKVGKGVQLSERLISCGVTAGLCFRIASSSLLPLSIIS